MIKFFRKIRQNMIKENRASKYMLYAIGEIALVMIGILLALQVNNWNENRKLNNNRQQLISSLIEDFKYNASELTQEIKFADSLKKVSDTYYKLTTNKTQLVSVDSLRELARSFFRGHVLNINLTAYNNANSTGSIGLLNSKILLQELTVFIENYTTFKRLNEEGLYNFFNGSSWELRKSIDINSIYGSNDLGDEIPFSKYKSIIDSNLAKAALNNIYILNHNIRNQLIKMDVANKTILETLETMKAD
tara:strand:- start:71 stop:814 length:744 start_codon:yes stop_codon:yes gene_type:complete